MIEFPEYKYENQNIFNKNVCSEIVCVITVILSICLSFFIIMMYFINTELSNNNTTTYIDHNR